MPSGAGEHHLTDRDAVELAERIEAWQQRLAPLGVTHWRFTVETTDAVPGSPGSDAGVSCAENYDTAKFYFDNDFVDTADDELIDTAIIHEWIHLLFRDFDNAIELVEPWMPDATYDSFNESVRQRREAVIERLARALYAFYAGNWYSSGDGQELPAKAVS